jgi:nicotinate dehydrogenase subunit A
MTDIILHVNGRDRPVSLGDPDTPLLYVLRDDLALHGPQIRLRAGAVAAPVPCWWTARRYAPA